MQFLVVFLVFGTIVYAEHVQQFSGYNPAYGYMKNIGIPEAERIRKAEEASSRLVGGVPAALGQYPFKAGIIAYITNGNTEFVSICGGSLISASRVLTAAHCWFDGHFQAWRFTIILGSIYLFSGGTRVETSTVALHPDYNPSFLHSNVAIAYFATPVSISATVAPVSLPSGSELFESFAGETAIAVGFGASGGIGSSQVLSYVSVNVISNSDCFLAFPIIQNSNICSSGIGGFCTGDSGAPLIINKNNRQILIGISLFGSAMGCQSGMPHASARVTSFMDFINQHMS